MWYSVELLENNTIFIQPTTMRLKHGAKGKVILSNCLLKTAKQIQIENS